MWELDYKESWVPKNGCFWTVVLEKTLGSPLDCREIQPVHPKGNQSWIFIGRTDAEAETPVLWPPDGKSWLIWKDCDAGRDWGQEEKGITEDEMVGWHHPLNGHGFGWTLGVGDGQGGLVCCSSWGRKESDMTKQLNWTEEKAGLKFNIQKMVITASSPITSWQIDREKMETVADFIFFVSKITADGDCIHEIKKMLAPWKKSYDKPRQHIKKQRHHFAKKFPYNQNYGLTILLTSLLLQEFPSPSFQ